MGSQVPKLGLEPFPRPWKQPVLTTRLPATPYACFHSATLNICRSFHILWYANVSILQLLLYLQGFRPGRQSLVYIPCCVYFRQQARLFHQRGGASVTEPRKQSTKIKPEGFGSTWGQVCSGLLQSLHSFLLHFHLHGSLWIHASEVFPQLQLLFFFFHFLCCWLRYPLDCLCLLK